MAKILSVGYLQDFLMKRAEVLAGAGYKVTSVNCVEDVVRMMEKPGFDVAIFGHGVPTEDRNLMTGYIKECCPKIAVIFLYSGSIEQAEAADAILNFHGAPDDLINTVKYLVEKKSNGKTTHRMAGIVASASAICAMLADLMQ